jgi:hypothetical protein
MMASSRRPCPSSCRSKNARGENVANSETGPQSPKNRHPPGADAKNAYLSGSLDADGKTLGRSPAKHGRRSTWPKAKSWEIPVGMPLWRGLVGAKAA